MSIAPGHWVNHPPSPSTWPCCIAAVWPYTRRTARSAAAQAGCTLCWCKSRPPSQCGPSTDARQGASSWPGMKVSTLVTTKNLCDWMYSNNCLFNLRKTPDVCMASGFDKTIVFEDIGKWFSDIAKSFSDITKTFCDINKYSTISTNICSISLYHLAISWYR